MAHSIGKTIAELRKAKGWTQIELAEKLQVSDKAVSKWEQEGGIPSVEFFPALAEVFGVSIDYLMTGKKVEPKIITISKIELCAKNDDVSMVEEINLKTKDENGKTLIDYIVQYKSYKVFASICDKKEFITLQGANDRNIKKFDVLTLIEFALITNKVSVLDRSFVLNSHYFVDDIKGLLHIDDYDNFKNLQGSSAKYACVLTDKVLDIIVQDKRVKPETILYLLSSQKKRECVWYHVLPYILHQSYLHNNMELFNKILNASISNNQYAYDNIDIKDDYYQYAGKVPYLRYFFVSFKGKEHGLVRALEKTIKLALERSDIETVEKLNNLNASVMKYYNGFKCYIATADEIRVSKLQLDKTVSKDELAIQSTIHNGIVCIDELLQLNDLELIKGTLNKYPIHQIEYLCQLVENKKWKEIFEYAVDNGLKRLVEYFLNGCENYYDGVENSLFSYEVDYEIKKWCWGEANRIANFKFLFKNTPFDSDTKLYWSVNKIAEFIKKQKETIIDDLLLKFDKIEKIGNLTKDYFNQELAKKNFDMVIIKLCVRLETILRCDYHYEGDLLEMLNQYFKKRDDSTMNRLLNALRIKRNSIVHSEKNDIELTVDDIKKCIDYICELGE